MLKSCKAILISLAAALCLAGYAETAPAKTEKATQGASPQSKAFPLEKIDAAKALAEQLAVGLTESLKSGDFTPFRDAQPKDARQLSPDSFQKMHRALTQRYGKIVGMEYLGRLYKGSVVDFLWAPTFVKDEKDPATRNQIVFWVRTGILKGEAVQVGFGFKFF